MLPPLNVKAPLPAVPPLTLPPHELVRAGVEATTSPDGKVSVKATLVSENELGFVIDRVSVDVPPAVMELGENDLLTAGNAWACKAGSSSNNSASSRFIQAC